MLTGSIRPQQEPLMELRNFRHFPEIQSQLALTIWKDRDLLTRENSKAQDVTSSHFKGCDFCKENVVIFNSDSIENNCGV
jgi:hypothetical protein